MIADRELDQALSTSKTLWLAMLSSLFIYLIVGLYLAPNYLLTGEDEFYGTMRVVLYVLSGITLIATKYVRKFLLSGKGQLQQSGQPSQHPATARYVTATIASLAMSEMVGVYSLVLFFVGKNPMDLYILLLVSAAAMVWYRPKREEIAQLAQNGQKEAINL